MNKNNLTTQSGLAHILGKSRQYVSDLKKAGRLVLDDQGRVQVRQSLALIEQTAGQRDDVKQRNAETRAESSTPTTGAGKAGKTRQARGGHDAEHQESLKQAQRLKALAESRRVQAAADKEEMERDRLAGNLIPREDVDAALRFVGAELRGLMDVFADQVAPLVAPSADLGECHGIISERCHEVLRRMADAASRQIEKLNKQGEA